MLSGIGQQSRKSVFGDRQTGRRFRWLLGGATYEMLHTRPRGF
jgi:hypothetical protein